MWIEVSPTTFYLPALAVSPLNATSHFNGTIHLSWLNDSAVAIAVGAPRFEAYGGGVDICCVPSPDLRVEGVASKHF